MTLIQTLVPFPLLNDVALTDLTDPPASVNTWLEQLATHGVNGGTLDITNTTRPTADSSGLGDLYELGWTILGITLPGFTVGAGAIDLTATTTSGNPVRWLFPDGTHQLGASGQYVTHTLAAGGTVQIQCDPLDVVSLELYGDLQDMSGLYGLTNLNSLEMDTVVPQRLTSFLTSLYHCNEPNSTDPLVDSLGVYDLSNFRPISRSEGQLSFSGGVGPGFYSDEPTPHLNTTTDQFIFYGFAFLSLDNLTNRYRRIITRSTWSTWTLMQNNQFIQFEQVGRIGTSTVLVEAPQPNVLYLIEFFSYRDQGDTTIGIAINGEDFNTRIIESRSSPYPDYGLMIGSSSLTSSSSVAFIGEVSLFGFSTNLIELADLETNSVFRKLVMEAIN